MLPTWFFDKKERDNRKKVIVEWLNNILPKDISNMIKNYSESEMNIYKMSELELYIGNKLTLPTDRSKYIYIIELTKKIYVRICESRQFEEAVIFAECKDGLTYEVKKKYNAYIGRICDNKIKTKYNTYISRIMRNKIYSDYIYQLEYDYPYKYKIEKDEYDATKNNFQYLMGITE